MDTSAFKKILEQHVEKIVLGLCGLVLLWGAHVAFLTKPTIELPVGPGQSMREVPVADASTEQKKSATQVSDRLNDPNAAATGYPAITLQNQFDRVRARSIPAGLGRVASFWSGQNPLRLDVQEVAKASLAAVEKAVPALADPLVNARRLVPYLPGDPNRNIKATLTEKGVATIASQFDLSKLRQNWTTTLSQTLIDPKVVIYDMQVEMQVLQPDGKWSESTVVQTARSNLDPNQMRNRGGFGFDDWDNDMGPRRAGNTGQVDRTKPQPIPEYTGTNAPMVLAMVQARQEWQQTVLQPEYYPFFHFDTVDPTWVPWQALMPKTALIREYETYLEDQLNVGLGGLGNQGGPNVQNPWGQTENRRDFNLPQVTIQEKTRVETGDERDIDGPGIRRPRRRDDDWEDDDDMGPPMGPPGRRPYVPGRVQPGEEIDPRTGLPVRRGVRQEEQDTNPAPKPTRIPSWAGQMLQGKVLIWAHYDKLDPGQQVRFRMRLRLVNPLLTRSGEVENEADAKQTLVGSPWSDWTDTVSLPEEGSFYIAGVSRNDSSVRVEVFRKAFDQWVKGSFKVRAGQAIGGTEEVDIFNPLLGVKEKRTIDFGTGGLAVDIDLRKEVPWAGGGVLPKTTTTTELFYTDALGNFLSRLRSEDNGNKLRTERSGQADKVEEFLEEVKSLEELLEELRQRRLEEQRRQSF